MGREGEGGEEGQGGQGGEGQEGGEGGRVDLSLGGGQGKERRPPVVGRIFTKEYLRDLPRPSEPLLPLLWAVLTTLTPTLSFLGFWVVYHSAIVGTSALRRDNNNKLKQQSTSNFVKENTLGIPEEILRVHLF